MKLSGKKIQRNRVSQWCLCAKYKLVTRPPRTTAQRVGTLERKIFLLLEDEGK